MAEVKIYTMKRCPYCVKLKEFFDSKGIKYTENDITSNENAGRAKLVKLTGGARTVPQIFINGEYFGDEDDLFDLDSKGKLDSLFNG